MTVKIQFKKLHHSFKLPSKATKGSAGFDMIACIDEPLTLLPGQRTAISLGCSVEIPEGYELQVRPRSGLALKEGLTVLNAPGTIDSDFRGEVKAILINHSANWFKINPLDRICQLVPAALLEVELSLSEELTETERGAGGFGSSGKS